MLKLKPPARASEVAKPRPVAIDEGPPFLFSWPQFVFVPVNQHLAAWAVQHE
jgi:hypothetical protein